MPKLTRFLHASGGRIPLRLLLILGGAVTLGALATASLLNSRLADRPVSIGLDADVQFDSPPTLVWGDGPEERQAMETIPGAFSTVQPTLQLRPSAEKNPASTGFDVWIAQHPRIERVPGPPLEKAFHPFELGQRYLWYQINPDGAGAPYTWARDADTPTLVFLRTPNSGMVRFGTPTGESLLDLYSPEVEVITVDESELAAARYHAVVPHHALADLRLLLPENTNATIHRLYIGTIVPRIYFAGDSVYPGPTSSRQLGRIQTQWLPESDGGALRLARIENGQLLTFAILFGITWLIFACIPLSFLLLKWLLRRACATSQCAEPAIAAFDARKFLVFFASFCVVYLFYLGCAWPGIMSNDSVRQWEQARTWDLTDDHPALHTLSIKLIASVWDSPAAVALVQILSMSLALAWAFSILLRIGTPAWIAGLLFHIALLSPKNGILGATLWKDVPFAILVLVLSILLLRLCYQRQKKLDFLYWIATGLSLGLLPLVRHNGLVILLVIAPLLPFIYWRWKFRALLLGTALSIILFASAKYGVYPALQVKGWEGLNSYLYTVKSAILIDQDVPLAREEYEFLNRIRPIGKDRWAFDAHTGNTTVNDRYDTAFAIENESTYARIFNQLSVRYPLFLVQDHLERSHYVYALAHPEGHIQHQDHYLSRPENQWHIRQKGYPTQTLFPNVAPVLGDLIVALQRGSCVLFRPALCLYLVLAALLILTVRMRAPRILAAFLPALLATASVLMVPIATQIRYQFPLTLTAAFLVGLAFAARPARELGESQTADDSPGPS